MMPLFSHYYYATCLFTYAMPLHTYYARAIMRQYIDDYFDAAAIIIFAMPCHYIIMTLLLLGATRLR